MNSNKFIDKFDVIFLDLDDCIIPWGNYESNYNYDFNKVKETTIANINVLKKFCDVFNFKIYLSSSWAKMLIIDNGELLIKNNYLYSIDDEIKVLFDEIKKLPIIELYTRGTREEFIKSSIKDLLKQRKDDLVNIIIDDFNLNEFTQEISKDFPEAQTYFIHAIDITPNNLENNLINIIWRYLNSLDLNFDKNHNEYNECTKLTER